MKLAVAHFFAFNNLFFERIKLPAAGEISNLVKRIGITRQGPANLTFSIRPFMTNFVNQEINSIVVVSTCLYEIGKKKLFSRNDACARKACPPSLQAFEGISYPIESAPSTDDQPSVQNGVPNLRYVRVRELTNACRL